jgi:hypothetical protein
MDKFPIFKIDADMGRGLGTTGSRGFEKDKISFPKIFAIDRSAVFAKHAC